MPVAALLDYRPTSEKMTHGDWEESYDPDNFTKRN